MQKNTALNTAFTIRLCFKHSRGLTDIPSSMCKIQASGPAASLGCGWGTEIIKA